MSLAGGGRVPRRSANRFSDVRPLLGHMAVFATSTRAHAGCPRRRPGRRGRRSAPTVRRRSRRCGEPGLEVDAGEVPAAGPQRRREDDARAYSAGWSGLGGSACASTARPAARGAARSSSASCRPATARSACACPVENLIFFARMHGFRRRAARERAAELLDAVGLSESARRPVNTYSHGMQKRLSFARALLRARGPARRRGRPTTSTRWPPSRCGG